MTASEYLRRDINKYKDHYNKCDTYEKIHFKALLKRYENQFEGQLGFLKWYLEVTK